MNLKELKETVDFVFNRSKNPEGSSVVITLSEPSIGSRAYSSVQGIYIGFDWETNQIRIEPSVDLVKKGNSLTDIRPIKFRKSFDKKNIVSACPNCDSRIAKTDCYCRYCGQRLV